MFDLGHLPKNLGVQVFPGIVGSSSAALQRYEWAKPVGAQWVFAIVFSGGAKGGTGASGTSGTARNGGGGGGSSPPVMLFCPAIFLPPVLHVVVGYGSDSSVAGGLSNVSLVDTFGFNSSDRVLVPWSSAPTFGVTLTAGWNAFFSAGVGWPGVTHMGALASTNAQNSNTGQTNIFPLGAGGAGGANVTATDTAGGGITGSGFIKDVAGGAAGGGAGVNGTFSLAFPRIYSTPGTGGGSSNTGTGGRGGDGAFGCGGGGGGAGVTGGVGGNGGPGLVIIISG